MEEKFGYFIEKSDSDTDSNATSESEGETKQEVVTYVSSEVTTDSTLFTGTTSLDSISVSAQNVTVSPGAGDDTVRFAEDSSYNVIQYTSGNDLIIGYNSTDTIQLISDTSISKVAVDNKKNVIFTIGEDQLILKGAAGKEIHLINTPNEGSVLTHSIYSRDKASSDTHVTNIIYNTNPNQNVAINGSGSDDSIFADGSIYDDNIDNTYGRKVVVDAGKGNDTISLIDAYYEDVVKFGEGSGSDIVLNFDDNDLVSLNTTLNSDVKVSGSNVIITVDSDTSLTLAGAKNQLVNIQDTSKTYHRVYTGKSNYIDAFYNDASAQVVRVSSEQALLNNQHSGKEGSIDAFVFNAQINGDRSTLIGDEGNDTIVNYAGDVSVVGGKGDDLIYLNGWNSTVNAGSGNDTIDLGTRVKEQGARANVIYYNHLDGNDVILGYNSSDKIIIGDAYVSKNALKGNDVIVGVGTNSSLTFKDVKDTILDISLNLETEQKVILFNDDKFNQINNELSDVEVLGTVGKDYIISEGHRVTINGDSDRDFIDSTGDQNSIVGGAGLDTFKVSGSENTIDSGSADDLVELTDGSKNLIITGDGKDTILASEKVSDITVDSGDSSDLIEFYNSNNSISAGAGDDTIISRNGGKNTIIAGKGNDLITVENRSGENNLFIYNAGDGFDTISGYKSGDTLKIVGAEYATLETTDGVIVHAGSGRITLLGAKGEDLTIDGIEEKVTSVILTDKDESLWSAWSSVGTIDGSNRKKKISITGNWRDNYINGGKGNDTLIGGIGNLSGNDTLHGGAGKDIFVYNSGNDVITDYQVGKDIISLTSGLHYDYTVEGSDVIFTPNVPFSLQGSIVTNNTLRVLNGLNKKLTVVDLLGKTKMKYTDPGLVVYDNYSAYEVTLESWQTTANATKRNSKHQISITGNMNDNSIFGGKGADTLYGGGGDDTLTGGNGKDVFYYGRDLFATHSNISAGDSVYGNPLYGNDVITDYAAGDELRLEQGLHIASSTLDNKDVELTIADSRDSVVGTITLNKARGKKITVTDGVSKTSQIYGEGNSTLFITNGSSETAQSAEVVNISTITNTSFTDMIDASKRGKRYPVYLIGNKENNYLIGGKGNDTLYGGVGENSLKGGEGKDTFIVTAGDTIIDYKASDDVIKISESITGSVIDSTFEKDITLNLGTGTLTIKNGNGKRLMIDDGQSVTRQIFGNGMSTLVAVNSDAATIEASKLTQVGLLSVIDATNRKKETVIESRDDLNLIIKGGTKDDTLISGRVGSDTLTGGLGYDVFVYQGGDVVITDYKPKQDTIQLARGIVFVEGTEVVKNASGKYDVVLKTNSGGSLTIKNGKDKKLNVAENGDPIDKAIEAVYGGTVMKGVRGDTVLDAWSEPAKYGLVKKITASTLPATNPVKIIANNNDTTIQGSKGADTIIGGNGRDYIKGNGGADLITAGGGADTIAVTFGCGADTVIDFDVSEDLLHLTNRATKISSIKVDRSRNALVVNLKKEGDTKGKRTSITLQGGGITNAARVRYVDYEDKVHYYNVSASSTLTSASYEERDTVNAECGMRNAELTDTSTSSLIPKTSSLTEHWFTEDNNFASTAPTIDDLTETSINQYSVNAIEDSGINLIKQGEASTVDSPLTSRNVSLSLASFKERK